MKFVVTVDTEEDLWGEYRRCNAPVTNIANVHRFQTLCEKYGVRPTYLVTYPITQDDECVGVFADILARGKCEVGMHCHPWNTPPFEEEISEYNSMLCNLPPELQYKKLESLDLAIQDRFGIKAVSFRAGRWGYSSDVAKCLERLRYQVDSSVVPFINWGATHGPDFTHFPQEPYRFDPSAIQSLANYGSMLEVPATVGLLGWSTPMAVRVWRTLRDRRVAFLKGTGILALFRIMQRVWLSPEQTGSENQVKLIRQLQARGGTTVNLVFHSSSLKAGLTPFVRTPLDEAQFYQRLEAVFVFAQANKFHFVTLSECQT